MIEITVDDEKLREHVAEFNADVRTGQWGDGASEVTAQDYLRDCVEGLCNDEIACAAPSLALKARVVSVYP